MHREPLASSDRTIKDKHAGHPVVKKTSQGGPAATSFQAPLSPRSDGDGISGLQHVPGRLTTSSMGAMMRLSLADNLLLCSFPAHVPSFTPQRRFSMMILLDQPREVLMALPQTPPSDASCMLKAFPVRTRGAMSFYRSSWRRLPRLALLSAPLGMHNLATTDSSGSQGGEVRIKVSGR
jgi:hypothetical protein